MPLDELPSRPSPTAEVYTAPEGVIQAEAVRSAHEEEAHNSGSKDPIPNTTTQLQCGVGEVAAEAIPETSQCPEDPPGGRRQLPLYLLLAVDGTWRWAPPILL